VFLLSCIVAILAVWFLTPLSDYFATLVLWTVSVDSDVALGREALISLEQKYPRVRDRWGVQRVGEELVKAGTIASREAKQDTSEQLFDNINMYEWDFGVVHAPVEIVNAFALPGGKVRVTDSLLKALQLTDGELAALLGHEMGHVLHRHTQKRAVKKRLLSTIWEAFTYEDNDGYDESFGEAVSDMLLNTASYLGELTFSRADEYQADETSWDLLAATYDTGGRRNIHQYHPESVKKLLQKLWDNQGNSGTSSWESTHPGTKDRIAALQKKWNRLSFYERRKFV
jgi:Zn-dependent protease with chaperone function